MKRFGTMLDMSRNGVMKTSEVKNFAKTLKSFGYNMIMLYTEDTYEVDGEPYFGYLRGRYTKEEMRDIVDYCASIGVEAIPCIQTLAHLGSIFRWSDFSYVNDFADILLIGEERTYKLIENMVSTLRECYDSEYIHIGMDEAHMIGLGKYLDKHGFPDRHKILIEHVKRVIDICSKYKFKPIMWSDMFFRLANGGEYYPKENMDASAVSLCPKEMGLVYWDYYKGDKDTYDAMLDAHKKFGNEVWFAGGCWSWEGFAPSNLWSVESMILAVESCRERDINNIFFTLWGDNGKECSYYSLLPSLFMIRCYYEGVTDAKIIKEEFNRLTGESFDAMMSLDVPNRIAGNRHQEANPCKYMLYSDPFLGFLDSTVKEGVGEEYSFYADILTRFAENSKSYAYIFKSEAALCRVLELKYDLGKRTREIYKSGDKDALRKLIYSYDETIDRLNEFYECFRTLWMKENKPHGFDVQDLRLGALRQRLESCQRRLIEYLEGRVDSIPELEEDILEYKHRAGTINGLPHLNSWIATVTVNNM